MPRGNIPCPGSCPTCGHRHDEPDREAVRRVEFVRLLSRRARALAAYDAVIHGRGVA